jgi:hypothetical protein
LVEPGNVEAFALAIAGLYFDAEKLNRLASFDKQMLLKFEPWEQARAYNDEIIRIGKKSSPIKKVFPKYPMGGMLNKPWIPNKLVRIIRENINHPKL